MQHLSLDYFLDILEINGVRRQRLFNKVSEEIIQRRITDPSQIYCTLIEKIENEEIVYVDWFHIRLDQTQGETQKLNHEIITVNKEEDPEPILETIPIEYYNDLVSLIEGFNVEMLIHNVASIEDIRERIEQIRRLKEEQEFIFPRGKEIKRVYFDEQNKLVVETNRREPGFDAVKLYFQHYLHVTRYKLQKMDSSVYDSLLRSGKLIYVPIERGRKQGAVEHYRKHHNGLVRSLLRIVDPELFEHLRLNGDLGIISTRTNNYNPIEEYNRFYSGVKRKELHQRDPSLYNKLLKTGHLEVVPLGRKPNGYDPIKYYLEYYPNVTRRQLFELDPSLYSCMCNRNLIGIVPLKRRENGFDPVEHYLKYYPEVSRQDLKKKDGWLYEKLRITKRLDIVPKLNSQKQHLHS